MVLSWLQLAVPVEQAFDVCSSTSLAGQTEDGGAA